MSVTHLQPIAADLWEVILPSCLLNYSHAALYLHAGIQVCADISTFKQLHHESRSTGSRSTLV